MFVFPPPRAGVLMRLPCMPHCVYVQVSKLRESAQELDPRLKSLTYLPEDNTPAGAPKPKPFVTRFKSPAAHQELATGKPFAKLQKDPINYRPLLD